MQSEGIIDSKDKNTKQAF